jgi:hypothetical protein
MRRPLAVLAGLALSLLLLPTPAAHAVGVGACTITGTIRFTAAPGATDRGVWDISPAAIQCRGMFNFVSSPRYGYGVGEQFTGSQQQFSGSGSYKTVPAADGGCLHELGEGTVKYLITTVNQDVHVVEKNTFHLAGAGTFTTPQLYGSFQIPLHDSQCLSAPATTALFLAEVAWVRTSGVWK